MQGEPCRNLNSPATWELVDFWRCPATFSAARSKGDVQLFDACTSYFGNLYISEDWGLPETQHELQGIQVLCGCPCGRIESGSIYRLSRLHTMARIPVHQCKEDRECVLDAGSLRAPGSHEHTFDVWTVTKDTSLHCNVGGQKAKEWQCLKVAQLVPSL